ncbi:sensor domain-containing diguanylate cyclase [Devosia sp. 2618]|uniref:GGDEF domain-containing protein n=1 Tax=Devosia sp. 2618 TaxID=3156454 RepID=UPI0033968426
MAADDPISPEILSQMLMRMFEFAPVAMAITTSHKADSRYVKVNDAYLKLTGYKWDDIKQRELAASGSAINSPARDERRRLLDVEGAFRLQEVDIKHVDGTVIPTLISAQRTEIGEQSYDIEIIIDISARVRLQTELDQALIQAARTDALTGLPNRASYDDFIGRKLAHDNACVLLAFIDLNGFKTINDTRGHAFGDKVLQHVGARLRDNCRSSDFVGRLGGDEFVVVLQLPSGGAASAFPAFHRMMKHAFEPMMIDGEVVRVGAAIGTAAFDPANDTAETLLNRADRCMYEAKSTGDIFHVVSDADLSTAQIERVRQCVG